MMRKLTRGYLLLLMVVISIIIGLDLIHSLTRTADTNNLSQLWSVMQPELDNTGSNDGLSSDSVSKNSLSKNSLSNNRFSETGLSDTNSSGSTASKNHTIQQLNKPLKSGRRVSLSQLAWPKESIEQLKQQGFLILSHDNKQLLFHGFLPNSQQVYITPINLKTESSFQQYWFIIFYSVLAIGIYLWFRPLLRDVYKVQQGALRFAQHQEVTNISISQSSPLKPVSDAMKVMTQRIQQLMNLQRDISTYVSHDIRTPLSRIKFMIESASDHNFKQAISEEVDEIESLVTELLQYAEFEHTQPNLMRRSVNLHHLIQSSIDKYYQASNIQLNNTVEASINTYVDPVIFKRAFENLINNAIRYARSTINISYRLDQCHRLTVEDDGQGIVKEKLYDLRRPFVRAEDSPSNENYGLGLAIVDTICVWHGGRLNIGNAKSLSGAQFEMTWQETSMSQENNSHNNTHNKMSND